VYRVSNCHAHLLHNSKIFYAIEEPQLETPLIHHKCLVTNLSFGCGVVGFGTKKVFLLIFYVQCDRMKVDNNA
jgi:hypothetical protein